MKITTYVEPPKPAPVPAQPKERKKIGVKVENAPLETKQEEKKN